jgi:chaperonin GroEL
MSKTVLFDDDAFARAKEGTELIKRAVGATLGPKAHNVIYGRPFGTPGIVHDGITVAKEIDPKDPHLKNVVELVKEAGSKTNDEAGDGTTTAILLAHSLYTEGRKLVTAGYNAQMVRRGVDKAVRSVVDYLERSSVPIKTNEQQLQVAVISAQNDMVGEYVAKAFKKLGNEAVITVEESKQNHIYAEYKDGMEIDQGYFSRYFLTSSEFDEAVVDKANIVVTDYSFTSGLDIQQLFEALQEADVKDNLVIIAPEVRDFPLVALLQNKQRGLHTLAVKAPSFSEEQSEMLEDIAISVGGTFISRAKGLKFEDLIPQEDGEAKAVVGHAQKVVASKNSTTIVNGMGNEEEIKNRVKMLTARKNKETTSEFEGERLQERIAKLTSGIAIINVGARTEAETKELKERTIDAVGAIKAANEKGIVAGGETALLRASWELEKYMETLKDVESDEVLAGYRVVIRAMQYPFKTLMENSGLDGGQMLERLQTAVASWPQRDERPSLGVDAVDGQVKDLIKAGIIDPVKVPVSALLNSASTAMGMLTSGVNIADDIVDKDASVV